MYVRSIRLAGIRGFEDVSIALAEPNSPARSWTLLVGSNGTGKSTILRAIAIGLADATDASAMLSSPMARMVGSNPGSGTITLEVDGALSPEGPRTVATELKRANQHESFHRAASQSFGSTPSFVVAGYGVARHRTGRELSRAGRLFDATQSLFSYDAQLTPIELTLRRLNDFLGLTVYEGCLAAIKRALRLPDGCRIVLPQGGGVEITPTDGQQPIPFESWADGYRLNFAWMIDFMGLAMATGAISPTGDVTGILLIDEIEQHAHPSIQRSMIAELKALWPNVQVIATTHSPLMVLGARAEEVVVLKKRPDGRVEQSPQPVSFRGYTAEDILNDERIFDTEPISVEDATLVDEYMRMAAQEPLTQSAEERERLSSLARQIGAKPPSSHEASEVESLAEPQSDKIGSVDEAELVRDLARIRQKYGL